MMVALNGESKQWD